MTENEDLKSDIVKLKEKIKEVKNVNKIYMSENLLIKGENGSLKEMKENLEEKIFKMSNELQQQQLENQILLEQCPNKYQAILQTNICSKIEYQLRESNFKLAKAQNKV